MHLVVRDCFVISYLYCAIGEDLHASPFAFRRFQFNANVKSSRYKFFDAGVRILRPYSIPHTRTGSYVRRRGGAMNDDKMIA